ncbi:SDR family NAD(P)-dependent oxidoreductase [Nocardia testacea]|uniref:SDR family NAD(P)-dependent oxidoreductase n=1 Tax=Nocardia testacea TaxID=248551 RepID=UPI003C2B9458
MSLAGKVAFVAGAGRGIGAAIAAHLADHGAAVAVAARSTETGRIPGTIHQVAARIHTGLATDLRPDNIAVNCLSPSRVVLTEGWRAAGGGDIPAEMVEAPETMGRAAVLLAAQDATGITGTVQHSEVLLADR